MLEASFAANAGEASTQQIECYSRCTNTLRRLFQVLGLHQGRKPRDVTPTLDLDRLIDAVRDRP
jgi:hypothetical protein